MPEDMRTIKVFISCPGDVAEERKEVREVCQSLTKVFSKTQKTIIQPLDWENDVIPEIRSEEGQLLINTQIGNDYDVYIGILWKRFGERQPDSRTRTESEFYDALERRKSTGKPTMYFFFKCAPYYPADRNESLQGAEVQDFKKAISSYGLYCEVHDFEGLDKFKEKVYECILYYVENLESSFFQVPAIPKSSKIGIAGYLKREICLYKDYLSFDLFARDEQAKDVLDLIDNNFRMVIISDAGAGKTTELKRIHDSFLDENSAFKPIYVQLNRFSTTAFRLSPGTSPK